MAKAQAAQPKPRGTKKSDKPARGSGSASKPAPSPASANGHAAPRRHAAPTPSPYALAFAADYAPAPESAKVEIAPRHRLFINGEFVEPREGAHFATINPATEAPLSEIARATGADVDAAVAAARDALPAWAGLPAKERAKYLYRIARRIQERARELAVLETLDGGKPIRESRDVDVPLAAAHFFYHAGWADKLHHVFGPGVGPVGVCGQIIPWNFPLLMAAWKLAPALACGNTCVLKPAETTSLTALRLAEIMREVGLPRGVVNIVTGAGETGAALVEHPGVDKIAFTGSTEVGKRIAKQVARQVDRLSEPVSPRSGERVAGDAHSGLRPETGSESRSTRPEPGSESRSTTKRLTLELGGKSPNIIFEDASLDQAIEGIVQGIYFNQGHVCCAGSRLFVQESVLGEVTKRLRRRLATLRVGDPMDKNTDVGAINSRAQLDTIERYLRAGVDEGAALRVCGVGSDGATERRSDEGRRNGAARPSRNGAAKHKDETPSWRRGLPDRGYWCRPCVFEGVQPSHAVAREEIFGPVLAVMSFRTPEEAITRANSTPYGLAAGVWTDKGSKIFEIARRLKAGVVWLNTYNKFDPGSPFGGFKESGFGREGGVQGLRAYVNLG
ncbi:MAG: aldehyde dehydrogenase family protein [Phycisphaerales bacterium]